MKLIIATDNKGGIGYKNDLLFWIGEDLKRFKELTNDSIVLMGKNTWVSLPNKLPNRINSVISKSYASHKESFLKFIPSKKPVDLLSNLFNNLSSSNTVNILSGESSTQSVAPDVIFDDFYIDRIESLEKEKPVWIIGGAQLFTTTLPLVSEVYLTLVKAEREADTFIDLSYIYDNFELISKEEKTGLDKKSNETLDYEFLVFKRK